MRVALISDLLGRPVRDARDSTVGKLVDLLVPANEDYPSVIAIAVKDAGGGTLVVPWGQVDVADEPQLRLRVPREALTSYAPSEADLFLAGQVLDRQIIDVNGVRVVRANDLQLERTNGTLHLMSVDVSTPGLLRRLGLEGPAQWIAHLFGSQLPHIVIDWREIDPVETGPHGVRLRIPAEDVAKLHPADLAAIISQLDHYHAEQAIEGMDVERAADTFEEIDPELQASLIEGMDTERAADILEEMDPDDAADLLGEIRPERQAQILERMEEDEARDVRELLGYPEDSAGGLMTTDFVALPRGVTAQQAIEIVRREATEIDNVYSLCVLDEDERLVAILSLRDLIIAAPDQLVAEIPHREPVSVHTGDSEEEAARLIAKYDLLALPVVDDDERVRGIITVDDAMDIILPAAWKKRVPRIFR